VRRRLFPGGYAPFLEVLGERLDQCAATAVSIVDGTDFVTVGGFVPVPLAQDEIIYEAMDLLLLAEDIAQLVLRRPSARVLHSTSLQSGPISDARRAKPVARREHDSSGILTAASASISRMVDAVRPQTLRMRG
jgi:hypothetical protein